MRKLVSNALLMGVSNELGIGFVARLILGRGGPPKWALLDAWTCHGVSEGKVHRLTGGLRIRILGPPWLCLALAGSGRSREGYIGVFVYLWRVLDGLAPIML